MNYAHIAINGDFNYPGIECENLSTHQGIGEMGYELIETVRDCFLYQHVHEVTRGRSENEPSLLDLVFSNEEGMISDLTLEDSLLGKSDHSMIFYNFVVHNIESASVKTLYKFNKADWEKRRKNCAVLI